MIDFSVGKLLLLAVIALLVLGPEKLPGAARTAGAMLRRVRRGWDSVRAEVTRELEAEELRAKLKEAQEATRAAMSQVRAQSGLRPQCARQRRAGGAPADALDAGRRDTGADFDRTIRSIETNRGAR